MSGSHRHSDYRSPNEHADRYRSRSRHGFNHKHHDDGRKHDSRSSECRRSDKQSAKTYVGSSSSRSTKSHQSRSEKDSNKSGGKGHSDRRNIGHSDGTEGRKHEIQNDAEKHSKRSLYKSKKTTDIKTGPDTTRASKINLDKPNESKPRSDKLAASNSGSNKTKESKFRSEELKETVSGAEKLKEKIAVSESARKKTSDHRVSGKESVSKSSRRSTHRIDKHNESSSRKQDNQDSVRYRGEKVSNTAAHRSRTENARSHQSQGPSGKIDPVQKNKPLSRENKWHSQHMYRAHLRGRGRGFRGRGYHGRGYTRYRDHRVPRGYSETNTGFDHSRPRDSHLPLDDEYRTAVDEGSYSEHTQYRERYEGSEDVAKGRGENYYSKRSDSIPRESSWDTHGSHRAERVEQKHFDREEKFQAETFNRDYRREDDLFHKEQVTKGSYDRTSWNREHVEPEDIQERNYQIRDRYKDDYGMADPYVEEWSDSNQRRYEKNDERKHFEENERYYHHSNEHRRHFDDNTHRHEQFQAENVYGEYFDEFDSKHEPAVSENRHTEGAQDYYDRQTEFHRQIYKRNDTNREKGRPSGRRFVAQNVNRGQSNSQQYYRNAKRKIVRGAGKWGNKTQRQFSSVNQHGNARNRSQSQLNKRASIKQSSTVSDKRSTERTEEAISNSQTTQLPERPKANPTVDRGASGCILKEDRPYEERQNEGFQIHMDPPLKKETASENRQKDDKSTDPLQQSVIFIPNQDFQQGARQAIDQFGNVVQLPEAPQGGLAPVPIRSHDGQEMIFIPFGSNAGLPENIVPVQQSNFPFGFLPQLVPADPMAQHQKEPMTKQQEDKSGKTTKSDDNKATNRKPLTSEQRARMRSKLMARRKQNLVKEVEKKVIENFLDRSNSIDSKSKISKDSSSRKSKRQSSLKNVGFSPSKTAKKDTKADIYEDVSDLEDVSEDEIEQLSDWENVSVDEIELDANERRPKFRKQNEPRTFIQHSATKRKLNVRRAQAQAFKQSEGESNPGQVYRAQPTEKTDMHSQRDHDTNVNTENAIPSNKSISKAYPDMYSDRVTEIKNKRDTQSDTRVYKAYTASRISEELKRVEIEGRLNRKEQAMSPLQNRKDRHPVQDRKTRNDSQRRRNIYESRPISPLQVTVKNNLYEKKDQSKECEYEHDEEGTPGDSQIKRDRVEHASHRGEPGLNLDNRFGKSRHNVTDIKQVDRNRFGNNSDSDRRIIREKDQGQSYDQNERQDISKQETFFRKMGNEETELDNNEYKKYPIVREQEKLNERETYSGMRRNIESTNAVPARTGGKGDNTEMERKNTFYHSGQDERTNYRTRTGHGYKPAQKYREGRRDNEDKPFSKREEPKRPESYREGNERPIKRFKSKENSSNKDDYSQRGTGYSDQSKKRGTMYYQHGEFSDENTDRKGIAESGDEEDDFGNMYPRKRGTSEFISTEEPILNNNSQITRPINCNETFDPSLPPIQNVTAMSAPTAPPLLDMSLPPPQLMSAQFASSPQVILQNQPVLAHQSQLQSIQQSQILGLQQSPQMQTLQRSQTGQQSALNFQPQMVGQQQSFQPSLSQQQNMGQSDASIQPQLQLQTQNSSQQQPQQRNFQVLIDHSQPMAHQLNVTQQQTIGSQQRQQQQMNSGSLNSFSSQAQNMNQPIQQSQSPMGTNPNPFQNVQQTLNTLGINQGTGMPARIVSVGQGQNVIQGQVTGQPQARGYLVPASFAGSFQGYNKVK